MNQRNIYKIEGVLTAETNLTVAIPSARFRSDRISADVDRIPRIGTPRDDAAGYWPASSILGSWRRSTRDIIRKSANNQVDAENEEEDPFDILSNYLHAQGTAAKTLNRKTSGKSVSPGKNLQLRDSNPALSLHGSWGLGAHLGCGNAYPRSPDAIFVTSSRYRCNEYIRSAEEVDTLSEKDQEVLERILLEDEAMSDEKKNSDKKIVELRKIIKDTRDEAEIKKLRAEIKNLEDTIKIQKSNKTYFDEQFMRPLSGYEVIGAGSEMDHKMTLANADQIELGILLATFREFARFPFMGGRFRDNCGQVSGRYKFTVWPEDEDPKYLGEVHFGFLEFGFSEDADELKAALDRFDTIRKDFAGNGINLKAV